MEGKDRNKRRRHRERSENAAKNTKKNVVPAKLSETRIQHREVRLLQGKDKNDDPNNVTAGRLTMKQGIFTRGRTSGKVSKAGMNNISKARAEANLTRILELANYNTKDSDVGGGNDSSQRSADLSTNEQAPPTGSDESAGERVNASKELNHPGNSCNVANNPKHKKDRKQNSNASSNLSSQEEFNNSAKHLDSCKAKERKRRKFGGTCSSSLPQQQQPLVEEETSSIIPKNADDNAAFKLLASASSQNSASAACGRAVSTRLSSQELTDDDPSTTQGYAYEGFIEKIQHKLTSSIKILEKDRRVSLEVLDILAEIYKKNEPSRSAVDVSVVNQQQLSRLCNSTKISYTSTFTTDDDHQRGNTLNIDLNNLVPHEERKSAAGGETPSALDFSIHPELVITSPKALLKRYESALLQQSKSTSSQEQHSHVMSKDCISFPDEQDYNKVIKNCNKPEQKLSFSDKQTKLNKPSLVGKYENNVKNLLQYEVEDKLSFAQHTSEREPVFTPPLIDGLNNAVAIDNKIDLCDNLAATFNSKAYQLNKSVIVDPLSFLEKCDNELPQPSSNNSHVSYCKSTLKRYESNSLERNMKLHSVCVQMTEKDACSTEEYIPFDYQEIVQDIFPRRKESTAYGNKDTFSTSVISKINKANTPAEYCSHNTYANNKDKFSKYTCNIINASKSSKDSEYNTNLVAKHSEMSNKFPIRSIVDHDHALPFCDSNAFSTNQRNDGVEEAHRYTNVDPIFTDAQHVLSGGLQPNNRKLVSTESSTLNTRFVNCNYNRMSETQYKNDSLIHINNRSLLRSSSTRLLGSSIPKRLHRSDHARGNSSYCNRILLDTNSGCACAMHGSNICSNDLTHCNYEDENSHQIENIATHTNTFDECDSQDIATMGCSYATSSSHGIQQISKCKCKSNRENTEPSDTQANGPSCSSSIHESCGSSTQQKSKSKWNDCHTYRQSCAKYQNHNTKNPHAKEILNKCNCNYGIKIAHNHKLLVASDHYYHSDGTRTVPDSLSPTKNISRKLKRGSCDVAAACEPAFRLCCAGNALDSKPEYSSSCGRQQSRPQQSNSKPEYSSSCGRQQSRPQQSNSKPEYSSSCGTQQSRPQQRNSKPEYSSSCGRQQSRPQQCVLQHVADPTLTASALYTKHVQGTSSMEMNEISAPTVNDRTWTSAHCQQQPKLSTATTGSSPIFNTKDRNANFNYMSHLPANFSHVNNQIAQDGLSCQDHHRIDAPISNAATACSLFHGHTCDNSQRQQQCDRFQ